jgi:hypothetical protein
MPPDKVIHRLSTLPHLAAALMLVVGSSCNGAGMLLAHPDRYQLEVGRVGAADRSACGIGGLRSGGDAVADADGLPSACAESF